jgi:outer membrane protein assembly factor BamB
MTVGDRASTRSRGLQPARPLDSRRACSVVGLLRGWAQPLSVTLRQTCRRDAFLALFAALLHTCAVLGQQMNGDQGQFAAATLPESNEALLCSSRVEEAIRTGDYRLAIELTERLMDLPGGLVVAPASRTYYPVWRQAFRLLGQLPPAGVELYRQLYDAEVDARFQRAASEGDVGVLHELFRGYRLSSAWPAIGVELAARLVDEGAYGEAIEVLREMTSRADRSQVGITTEAAPQCRAQLVVALGSAGAIRSARRLLDELQSDADVGANPEWRERLDQLEVWLAGLQSAGEALAIEASGALAPCIEAGSAWRQAIPPEGPAPLASEEQDLAEAVDVLRRLPLQQPVLAGETLLVRLHGRVWAFDAETLLPRWSAAERLSEGVEWGPPSPIAVSGGRDDIRLSPDAKVLMSNRLRHAVSVGFGKVYSVEGLTSAEADFGTSGRRVFQGASPTADHNELVARDLESGRVVWRTKAEAASPLYGIAFQDVPLVVGDSLVVPIQRGDDLALAVLDPVDGDLIREVPLVGPPTYFTSAGGRCLMIADATTLYVCTGNGVIAALGRQDLSWKWATVYPNTLAEHLGQSWWQPAATSVELNVDLPVIADDLLVVAPIDSSEMFALDRFDGRERWRMSRREYPYLIGALPGGLVVGGGVVACLDLNDPAGHQPRWRSVPLRITGRATISDERVFVPTRAGIVALDGRTGKVLADQAGAAGPSPARPDQLEAGVASDVAPGAPAGRGDASDSPANLLVSGDTLFSVSPSRVVKYPDLRRVRARYAALADKRVGGAGDALVLAWLDALEGRYEEALARLQAPGLADSRPAGAPADRSVNAQFTAARDQLLTYVFLGLARDASAGEDRLGWLRRASALADSPGSAAQLAITIGRALEGSGQWAAALRHYGELLCQPEVCQVADRSEADRGVAGWLHAAERIAEICARVPAGVVDELVERVLSSGDREAINLQRLRVALMNEPQRERVDQLLSLQELAPELKVQYLPRSDPTTLPVELCRRMQLERWDTHTSLGDLEQARADREVWEEHFEQPSPLELRDRVEAIDLAARKLAQARGQPFTEHVARQWRIERAELLLDPRRPLTGSRPWVLVTNLEQQRIELINAFKHEHPQRQTEDGLLGVRDGTGRPVETPTAPFGVLPEPSATSARRFDWEGGQRRTWPVVTYEHLAAIPIGGGLICVGMGPERYAGRRQWEYAVPEWSAVSANFADCSVAGPQGVFFCPRGDRVVLVGWFDGRLWWQRNLPGVTIERLYLIGGRPVRGPAAAGCGEQLVIVSDDQRVWVLDTTFGRRLREVGTGGPAASGTASIEAGQATPRRIDVVGDTIVIWGSESVVGIDGERLVEVWRQACGPVADTVVVEAALAEALGSLAGSVGWIAYRVEGELEWHLLDAVGGGLVFEAGLGEYDALTAVVVDSARILVAGRVARPEDEGELRAVRVSAFDPTDGTRLWSHDFPTTVAVNSTQLAAHPDLIPILLAGVGGAATGEAELPAIQLVNKHDGELGQPLSIKGDYRPVVEASCEMYMLVTPTRMIVQAGGNLLAYGNSPLRSGP